MSDIQAAPVEVAAPPPAPPPAAAPSIDDGLREAMAAHSAKIRAMVPEATQSAPVTNKDFTLSEVAANAIIEEKKREGDAKAESAQGQQEAKEEPAKEEPQPSKADALAKFIRAGQERERQAKALAAERAQLKAQQEAAAKAQQEADAHRMTVAELEALKAKDPVGYILKTLGPKAFKEGNILVDLINRSDEAEAEPAKVLTEEEREEQLVKRAAEKLRERMEAEEKERQAKAKEEQERKVSASRETFYANMAAEFKANADAYPYLAADPVPTSEIDEHFKAEAARGNIMSSTKLLEHFNQQRQAKAERLIAALQARQGKAPAPAPVKTRAAEAPIPAAERLDSRGRVPPPIKSTGLDYQKSRAQILADLEARDRASR